MISSELLFGVAPMALAHKTDTLRQLACGTCCGTSRTARRRSRTPVPGLLFGPAQEGWKSSPTEIRAWGSWTDAVSQRDEQERLLAQFSEGIGDSAGFRVRTGGNKDMPTVSRLCVETFRGPYEWWMLPLQVFQVIPAASAVSASTLLVLVENSNQLALPK